ncbi:VOC family protein [Lewinella sp. IMCC34183]|uniref:VOC family protein n=1 Tax=Lewinella sp. IMCC34183 TaxID=2248762 RepID=UPI000E252F23|nr:VOC family protein [Lewinella sp. IMCC34183]
MLDHLVYVVADLSIAVDRFSKLGYPPVIGGRHPARGTHNALLRLGDRSYLELLAVDPATSVPPPRWMGIDLVDAPVLSRWALHAGAEIVRMAELLGSGTEVQAGSRDRPDGETLSWRLTDPGPEPAVSVLPFLIDWGGAEAPHPADTLPDLGLYLTELRLFHPAPDRVNPVLHALGSPFLAHPGDTDRIEAVFTGPAGRLVV